MKKMMIALAILGITFSYADAQTCNTAPKKAKTHTVAKVTHRAHAARTSNTYQVCREEGGYYTCCVHKNTTALR